MKKTFLAATLICAAVVGGCSGEGQGGGGFSMPPMPVEVATVETGTITDKFEAVGNVNAVEEIMVVSQIEGIIVELPFPEGKAVGEGDLIARLEDTQLAAEASRAEALRDQSRTRYERVKSVVEQKAAAPQELDDAASALKVAEADYTLAESRLRKTRITAPFAGIIGARHVSIGEFIRPGHPITQLANIEAIRVGFTVPERLLGLLTAGAAVSVTTPAFPDLVLKGEILVIEPRVDPVNRSASVVAYVPNTGGKLRPGMSANITAVLTQREKALTVPSEAIFAMGDQSFVYLVKEDSSVAMTPVALGARTASVVEVTSGLSDGAMVVTAGHQKLFDGAKVMGIPRGTK